MDTTVLRVGMADYKISKAPNLLTTLGLGSCVGVILYDQAAQMAGLAHVMLPDSTQIANHSNRAKFADTAITDMFQEMLTMGASKDRLVAKLAGGAQMFAFATRNDLLKIGNKNVEASKEVLKQLGIPILAEDTGKSCGRTIEFSIETGMLRIRKAGMEDEWI